MLTLTRLLAAYAHAWQGSQANALASAFIRNTSTKDASMNVDDNLCLCFHVSWRKVINFIRVERVRVPSQLAECQSAGTGCGWCRKAMTRLFDKAGTQMPQADELQAWLDELYPNPEAYAEGRKRHIAEGRGTPPS